MIRKAGQHPYAEPGHNRVRRSGFLLVFAAGCMVGPARLGFMPRMAPIGESRDPDPTRVPGEQGLESAAAQGHPEANAPVKDPLPLGRFSTAVSGSALLFWVATGKTPLLGVYGTFDETGLVNEIPDDEKPVQ